MTCIYNGNKEWELLFNDGQKVELSEQHIMELCKESEKMFDKGGNFKHGNILEEQNKKEPSNKNASKT